MTVIFTHGIAVADVQGRPQQAADFFTSSQLILGNSGVGLADNQPADPFSLPIDGMRGTGFGLSEFGYMEIELGESGAWKGRLLGKAGAVLADCASAVNYETGLCEPASKQGEEPR